MNGQQLYCKAKRLIPGATQLLSKRCEMFLPDLWPAYYTRAAGVCVTDLDGKDFVDMSIMGVGACVLGYADEEVDRAAHRAIDRGVMCTLNSPEEVDLAELLCELHPWADMVRYARSGGEAMAVAVRIARAFTGRDKVAFCGYHGWSDWYLAANLDDTDALNGHLLPGLPPAGVPRGLAGSAISFHYNDIDAFQRIIERHGRELAAVVMEPQRGDPPADGFLEEIRNSCDRVGAVLIFDEITTGFRMTTGGIHLLLNVQPDIAVFAKAMANGYAMAAIIGKSYVMDAAQLTFISSTNWTERIGPSAALATIEKFRRLQVACHIQNIGQQVQRGWRQAAAQADLKIQVSGLPGLCHFSLEGDDSQSLMTLFTQLMMDKGFLASSQFKPSYAHKQQHIDAYLKAVCDVFQTLSIAQAEGAVTKMLKGPPASKGFYRLTS